MNHQSAHCTRSCPCVSKIATALLLLFAATSGASAGELKISHNADGVLISEDGSTVLQYQLTPKSIDGKFTRSSYIHPLFDLNGEVITEDFPEDHLHHRGIFWAWHQVWVGDKKIGDPWLCKNFESKMVAQGSRWNTDKSVTASATVVWHSPELMQDNQTIPIAQERVEVTVYPRADTYRIVEFQLEFLALLPDVRVGGSEDAKGYGGFSPRIKLSEDQTFVSESKAIEPVKHAIDAGPWVDISTAKSGVAILTHPSNPGSPEPWILRRKRSMQNARYPGRTPTTLSTDTPLVQRYQLVIHNGPTDSKLLNELHSEFASSGK